MKTRNVLIGSVAGLAALGLISTVDVNLNIGADYTKVLHPYGIVKDSGLFGTTYNIRLGNELGDADSIAPEITTVEQAGIFDTVVFHIEGYGGDVDGLIALINAIKLSKAHVVMSVEGPSYSAYAVLATQGDELRMSQNSFLMFHTSSLVNYNCANQTGEDRGVSNVTHCEGYYNANMSLWYKILDSIKILSSSDIFAIESGHDVYLTADQVNARLDNGKSPKEDLKAKQDNFYASVVNTLIQIEKYTFSLVTSGATK